jgi:tetratricopeptide (TPR) repeat protein
VRTLLEDRPETIFVATLLDLPEVTGGARLVDSGASRRGSDDAQETPGADYPLASTSLSGVHTVIDDDVLTAAIGVSATPLWARAGGSSNRSDWALARAKKQGLGLGEYLAGYHDLVDHYTAATWPTRALVDLVADRDRSGIGEVLPQATARMQWERVVPTQLPRDELRTFTRLSAIDKERRWRGALTYACDVVLGCAALVTETPEGLTAGEFARVHIDQGAISTQLWEYLLHEHPTTPRQRVDLGVRALGSGTAQRALRAFESVLFFRDSDVQGAEQRTVVEVIARRGIAIYHARTGRDEQAVMVYTDLVDTFGDSSDPDICEQVAQALLGIGLTFGRLGSLGQAVSAYTELADRYRDHPSPILGEYVAKALLGQATTLAALGRHDEERAAYADIITRYPADASATVAAIVDIARAATQQTTQATS